MTDDDAEMYALSMGCLMGDHHLCPGHDSLGTPCPCRCHREIGAATVTAVVEVLEAVGSVVVQAADVRFLLDAMVLTGLDRRVEADQFDRLALAVGYRR